MFYSIYCHLQVYTTISIIICRRAWSKEASMESCPFLGGLNKYPALSVSGLACDYNAQCCGTWSLECDSCRHLYHAAVTTLKGPPSSDPLVPPPTQRPPGGFFLCLPPSSVWSCLSHTWYWETAHKLCKTNWRDAFLHLCSCGKLPSTPGWDFSCGAVALGLTMLLELLTQRTHFDSLC